jgi:hypothetical protein
MRRPSSLEISIASALVMTLAFASSALSQCGLNDANGGTRLGVSRASDPAPVTTTTSAYRPVVSGYWDMIALANARLVALSFAPARGTYVSRSGAVLRRAIR